MLAAAIADGADPSAPLDVSGTRPIHIACNRGHNAIVQVRGLGGDGLDQGGSLPAAADGSKSFAA
jgi:ankyrin repeat protein